MTVKLTTPKVKVFDQVEINIAAIAEAITFNTQITACEVTMPIQVTGSNIMLPIDVQSSYVALPVDIQAEMCVIRMDIVAQTIGNIAMDIAAVSIGEISIKCGDVTGNVNITIASAQKVGLLLQPEWAAKEQIDKDFWNSEENKGIGTQTKVGHLVPAGERLYITHIGGTIVGQSDADRDKNQICEVSIWDDTDEEYVFAAGGNGGVFSNFSKPLAIDGGHDVYFMINNYAGHTVSMRVAASGYEV